MIKIFKQPLLSLICLIVISGIIMISCKKNKDVKSDKTELLSFGPTGAVHGDTLQFIGNNLDKVTEIDLTGATITQAQFVQQSPELILIIVPTEAEKGFVTLKTSQGDIVSKTQLDLDVETTVTSITPEARPGEKITIKGQYMNWVTRVTFANNKPVDSFISQSLDQLVVTVPKDAQTGPLVISYAGTKPKDVETADTVKVTLPQITSVSPNPIKHASNVTLTGTDLDLVKQVKFTGAASPVTDFVSQSATSLVVKIPGETTKGQITVVAASGVSTTSSQELDLILPVIDSLRPNPIDAESNLSIFGKNLDLVTGISFVGGAVPIITFVSQSATKIVVKVPKGTLKGKITLSVLNNSKLTVSSVEDLVLNGGLPPLADFPFPIYTDATQNGFGDWSYTDIHDFNSTANVRQGAKSILAVYNAGNGYQGITFHNDNGPATKPYSKLEFSVFGDAGTGGKTLNVVINGAYGSAKGVTIKEGEWSTFSSNLSDFGITKLTEIVLQSAGWGGAIHIDHVGLR
jgi:hypothetical protein